MNISMDKYKTAEVGKALKKVFRGEFSIDDSIAIAKEEIQSVFNFDEETRNSDTNDGFIGDVVGACPLCKENVVRTRFGYGCLGYKDKGCKFGVSNVICSRVISVSNMKKLLQTGKTDKISGFISPKTGNKFDAFLKLENGKAVFEF